MTREELIEKFNRQKGYIDEIDAFLLTDVYLNHFKYSNKYDHLSSEEQLIIMWNKLLKFVPYTKKTRLKERVFVETKVCRTCNKEKENNEFSIRNGSFDGLQAYCKQCHKEKVKKSSENRKEYVWFDTQICRKCHIEKDRSHYYPAVGNRTGLSRQCFECYNEYCKEYVKKKKNGI